MESICKKGKGYKRSEREKSMWKVAKGKRGRGQKCGKEGRKWGRKTVNMRDQ